MLVGYAPQASPHFSLGYPAIEVATTFPSFAYSFRPTTSFLCPNPRRLPQHAEGNLRLLAYDPTTLKSQENK